MASTAELNRLKTLAAQATRATPAQQQKIVNDNKDFIQQMINEVKAIHGDMTPRASAIVRLFGLEA